MEVEKGDIEWFVTTLLVLIQIWITYREKEPNPMKPKKKAPNRKKPRKRKR